MKLTKQLGPKRRVNIIEIGPGSIVTMSDREYIVDKNGAVRLLAKKEEPNRKGRK